jgi:NACalpha-BTF3-like transcription factor
VRAEHRHELKTNELAEWLSNLPQWAKENLKIIIYLSVVAVLVIGAYLWKRYQKNVVSIQKQLNFTNLIAQLSQNKPQILQGQAKGVDLSYMLLQVADNLQAAAQDTKNNQMAALALIKQAEARRTELHYRLGTVTEQDIQIAINQAKTSYTKALERAASNPSLTAMAEFGLGLCEEELGNFDNARQIYSDLAANPDLKGTVAVAQAKQRLETMSDYQTKVVFIKTSKPVSPGTMIPQVQLAPPFEGTGLAAPEANVAP